MTEPKEGLKAEEIAKIVSAMWTAYENDKPWDELDDREKAVIAHGVRVVQEGNPVEELYRQFKAAEAGDADLDTSSEWVKLTHREQRRWYLFFVVAQMLGSDAVDVST